MKKGRGKFWPLWGAYCLSGLIGTKSIQNVAESGFTEQLAVKKIGRKVLQGPQNANYEIVK